MSILDLGSMKATARIPVLIIGAGACGLTAGLAARDVGTDTLIIERDEAPLGNTSMSQGTLCAAGTEAQRRSGIEDSPELFMDDVRARVGASVDAVLLQSVAEGCGPAVDWLTNVHRVPFDVAPGWAAYGHSAARLHVMPSRTGAELLGALGNAYEAAGGLLMTSAEAIGLFADRTGVVAGARVKRADGSEEDIACDALVIATCGFGANRDMLRQYIPDMADVRYFGWEGATGDGIRWGQALGAGLADMDSFQNFGFLADPQGIPINPELLTGGAIQVNLQGERFSNEVADVSGQGNRVAAQPGGTTWLIFDERIHEDISHLPEYREAVAFGALRRADTLFRLGEVTKLPVDALTETISSVWDVAEGLKGDPFGRAFDARSQFKPPYCAIKVTCALFHTQGGLMVDGEARVLRPDRTPLPNLFAGGGAARNLAGPRSSGYLPGAGLCCAITLGRLAGQSAARHVLTGVGKAA